MKIFRRLSFILIILALLSIILLWFFDIRIIPESPILFFLLIIIFIGLASIMTAGFAAKSFIKTGNWAVIWIGMGALILGIGTGLSSGFYQAELIDVNITVTIYVLSSLAASSVFLNGAFLVLRKIPTFENVSVRIVIFIQLYFVSMVIVGIIYLISSQNVLPEFFIPGSVGTPIRLVVMVIAIVFFLISGFVFFRIYLNSGSAALYFCSASMTFFAVGLLGFMLIENLGSVISWSGRIAQSLGGLYLLLFILSIIFESKKRKISPTELFDLYFRERITDYKVFFESLNEAFVVIDTNEKILAFNKAYKKFYRFKDPSEYPRTLSELSKYIEKLNLNGILLPEEYWCIRQALKGNSAFGRELMLTRKDTGEKWFGSYNASPILDKNNKIIGAVQSIRDTTHQKLQEQRILSLSKFPSENPNPVFRIGSNLKILYSNKAGIKILKKMGPTGLKLPEEIKNYLTSHLTKSKKNIMTIEAKIGKAIYEFTIIPIVGKNYFNIYAKDITEIKRAEKIKIRSMQNKILEIERKKIARELHDTVSQNLFSSSLFSDTILKAWGKDPKKTLKYIKKVRDLNAAALSDIHILLYDLIPEKIFQEDLKDLIERLLNSVKKDSKIKTEFKLEGDHNIDPKIKQELYRVAQETLNNILKHSEATLVKVHLRIYPDELKMAIADNGKGFDINSEIATRRFGLQIMKERARLIGASLSIESIPGKGTTITLLKKNTFK